MKRPLAYVLIPLLTACQAPGTPPGDATPAAVGLTAQPAEPVLTIQSVTAVSSVTLRTVHATPAALVTFAACASDEVLTGGGCECSDDVSYIGRMKSQYPYLNAMYCACVNSSGTASNHLSTAHAICVKTSTAPVQGASLGSARESQRIAELRALGGEE